MMKKFIVMCTSLLAVLLSASNVSAATVEVSWTEPEKYRDIRSGEQSRKHFEARVFKSLTEHFEKMAEKLPENQTLKVDITDVDLAGDVNAGGIRQIRIVKDLYFPRIKFSYQLLDSNNETLIKDEANVKDMGFMQSSSLRYKSKSFGYEKKMLDEWFAETFKPE